MRIVIEHKMPGLSSTTEITNAEAIPKDRAPKVRYSSAITKEERRVVESLLALQSLSEIDNKMILMHRSILSENMQLSGLRTVLSLHRGEYKVFYTMHKLECVLTAYEV